MEPDSIQSGGDKIVLFAIAELCEGSFADGFRKLSALAIHIKEWTPNSSDLSPCNFFLWGNLSFSYFLNFVLL